MRTRVVLLASLLGLIVTAGCAHTIEGTTLADTPDGRTIVGILAEVREALQRDGEAG